MMKIKTCPCFFVLILFLFLVTGWLTVEAHDDHKRTGHMKNHHQNPKHHPPNPKHNNPTDHKHTKKKHNPPNKPKHCNHISPKCSSAEVTHGGTKAILTLNSFQKGGDGGGPSECDGKFHSDDTLIVALSTRWFAKKKRCFHYITINGNGKSVKAKVVDECDSRRGCKDNLVDASLAVWKALGVPKKDWGEMPVSWSDA